MKIYKILLAVFFISSFSACKKMDDLVPNPNSVDPSLASVDLLLNQSQLSFTGVFNTLSDVGGELTRQQTMYGGPLYSNAYSTSSFDGVWTTAYTGVIKNANTLIPLALKQKKYVQAGMAQVLKAYTLGTLVDFFGDVPNSESVLGEENLNPKADAGLVVYNNVIELLDSSISNFSNPNAGDLPINDLFFNGNVDNWITTAKTLKLKFLLQKRLIDPSVATEIEQLITDNDLIDQASKDFTFRYSTVNNSPDSRHPHYANNYNNSSASSNSANDYIGTYFMWCVGYEKDGGTLANTDPRRRYYFYRQKTSYATVNENNCPCSVQPVPGNFPIDMPFCLPGSSGGYWGRDHGNNEGVPPDNANRTTWGIYPAGGDFDDSQGTAVDNTRGGKGAGINPIWLSSFTYFLEAEAALKLNISAAGTPIFLLEKGIRESIKKVIAFPASVNVVVPTNRIPRQSDINNYVSTVTDLYNAAVTDEERLNIIEKEYYIATWGNGIEPYNNYRRTGKPDNMQLAVKTPTPGYFIRSLFYPSIYVNRNQNAPAQKSPGVSADKVFWDNNPDNFIN